MQKGEELPGIYSVSADGYFFDSPGDNFPEVIISDDDKYEMAVYKGGPISKPLLTQLGVEINGSEDLGLKLYRHPESREIVIDFYSRLTGMKTITGAILEYSDRYSVPLSLAFALSWIESGFSPGAVNRNSSSVDRGLFQLNSKSFPGLTEQDFYNPQVNAQIGLQYLSKCIELGGNEIVGLAMYNAGRTRVEKGGTPLMTLDYISRILDYQAYLEQEFEKKVYLGRLVLREKVGVDSTL